MSNLIDNIAIKETELEPCLKELEYTISADTVKAETKSVVTEFANYADLPGFRKGKVPASLIQNKFKDKINEELMQRFFSTAFEKTSKDESFDIVTYAMDSEEEPSIKAGADFVFKIKYDVAPEINIPAYDSLTLTKPVVETSEDDIKKQMDYYKDVYAEYKTMDTAAEAGDMLKVSYTSDCELDDSAAQTAKNLVESNENWIWLNEPETIPGAIAGLTGAEAGKEYTLTSEFAADHKEVALAGKTVNYTINVAEVQRRTPVETEEELCEKMSLDSIDALREQIASTMAVEAEQKAQSELKDAALESLVEKAGDFTIPPTTLSNEVNKQLQAMAYAVKSEEEAEEFKANQDAKKAEAEDKAKDRLRRFFISRSIANKEGIKVEQSEVNSQIEMLSRYYGYSVDQLRQMMEQSGGMNDIHVDLLVNKVTDFIVEKANVS